MYNVSGLAFAEKPYSGIVTPTRLYDASRFKNHGTHTNVTMVQLPKGLWVRGFNGSSSYTTINGMASLLQLLTVGSISIWWKPNNLTAGQTLFSVSDSGDADSRFILYNNAALGLYAYCSEAGSLYYNKAFLDTNIIVANAYHHVVLTHNGTVPVLYLNAVAKALNSGGADPTKFLAAVNNIDDVSLGANNTSGGRALYLNGDIALPKIRNYVPSAGQVKNIYEKELRDWFI